MKATKQYFPVVLFIMLYKKATTFDKSADETPQRNHSNRILSDWYGAAISCLLRTGAVQTFEPRSRKLRVAIQMKATENYFAVALLVMSTEIILAFMSVDDRGSVMDILYWGQIKTENIWYMKGWNAKGERRTKHNQFRMFLPDTRETWENWAARFFQVTIHFHPDHTWPKALIDRRRVVLNYYKLDRYYAVQGGSNFWVCG